MVFSPCGRYLHLLSQFKGVIIARYDLRNLCKQPKRYIEPFGEDLGRNAKATTLALHAGRLHVSAVIGTFVFVARLPADDEVQGKVYVRLLVLGPHVIMQANKLQVLWPDHRDSGGICCENGGDNGQGDDDRVVVIARSANHLRVEGEDGCPAGLPSPIILAVRERDLGPWNVLDINIKVGDEVAEVKGSGGVDGDENGGGTLGDEVTVASARSSSASEGPKRNEERDATPKRDQDSSLLGRFMGLGTAKRQRRGVEESGTTIVVRRVDEGHLGAISLVIVAVAAFCFIGIRRRM
jgi:hypothetical protein